jgi:hypothetical protein
LLNQPNKLYYFKNKKALKTILARNRGILSLLLASLFLWYDLEKRGICYGSTYQRIRRVGKKEKRDRIFVIYSRKIRARVI